MDSRPEVERIEVNNDLSSMPANPWEFDVALGSNGRERLAKILAVLAQVAQFGEASWPSDDHWRVALPDWLKSHLPELSKEQTDHLLATTPREQWNTLPWDFGSWLDAVRDRGWRWWGYKSKDDGSATLVLHIAMLPERIDAFKHLLSAAGIQILAQRYPALASGAS
jgi:hypothetical protein